MNFFRPHKWSTMDFFVEIFRLQIDLQVLIFLTHNYRLGFKVKNCQCSIGSSSDRGFGMTEKIVIVLFKYRNTYFLVLYSEYYVLRQTSDTQSGCARVSLTPRFDRVPLPCHVQWRKREHMRRRANEEDSTATICHGVLVDIINTGARSTYIERFLTVSD